MQSDYISRQAAIDACFDGWNNSADDCARNIKSISAADVAPIVYGKWIRGKYTDDDLRYNDYSYCCNRCGKIVNFEENYCPKCGAKMDGGKS